MSLDEIADKLIEWAIQDSRVRALWIEAATMAELRRPYGALQAHLAADEPQYPDVVVDLQRGLKALGGVQVLGTAEVPRFAREIRMELAGRRFSLVAEQSYLLAKRPRAAVVPLVDKTGHLPHVLDYSRRG